MTTIVRRRYSGSFSVLLGLLWLGASPAPADSAGGFEQGFSGWARSVEDAGGTVQLQLVEAPGLGGRRVAELTLTVRNRYFTLLRNELVRHSIAQQGARYRYEFRQYVPSDFARSPLRLKTAQFLSPGLSRSSRHRGWGPSLSLGITDGHWQLVLVRDVSGSRRDKRVPLGPVRWNHWERFRIEVVWSAVRGEVRFAKNGRVVLHHQGPTLFPGEAPPVFRCGLYTRRIWGLAGQPAPLDHFRILLDGFTVQKMSR